MKFHIILCTYNHDDCFYEQQIQSILDQTEKNWVLYISDDSVDDSVKLKYLTLKKKLKDIDIKYFKGPQKSFSSNFLTALKKIKIDKDDQVLFCDQDDIWFSNKLETYKKIYNSNFRNNNDKSVLICGRTEYIDENNKSLGFSPLFLKQPSFKNALVQSIAGGNTMMINYQLFMFINKFKKVKVYSHDWWIYILNELNNGVTHYTAEPYIYYRQHPDSIIGGNTSIKAFFKRLILLLSGEYRKWNILHIETISENLNLFKNSNVNIKKNINLFLVFRSLVSGKYNIFKRLLIFKKYDFYRQTLIGNIAMVIAIFIKKF